MPIHFSIGFVIESMPRSQFESVCADVYAIQEISAQWVRSEVCGDRIGCCDECIPRELICVGENNSKRFLFSVFEYKTNDEFDISGASDIVFTVSDGVSMSGNLYAGGAIKIEKKLSEGDVILAGTGYQFIVDINPSDTALLEYRDNYWDVTVTTSGGDVYTVKAGIFRVTKTNAGI